MNNDEIKETSLSDEQSSPLVEIGSSELESGVDEERTPVREAIHEASAKSELKQADDGFSLVFKEPKRLALFILSIVIALALIVAGSILQGIEDREKNAVVASGSTYKTITTDASETIFVTNNYQYLKFTPKTSGTYSFYTVSSNDTYGLLRDDDFDVLTSDDNSGTGNNFRISRYLYSGSTYYIGVKSNGYSFSAVLYVIKE